MRIMRSSLVCLLKRCGVSPILSSDSVAGPTFLLLNLFLSLYLMRLPPSSQSPLSHSFTPSLTFSPPIGIFDKATVPTGIPQHTYDRSIIIEIILFLSHTRVSSKIESDICFCHKELI